MKHLFFSVGLLCLMAAPISVSAQAQSTKDLLKERKELVKASKAELNAKATKAAQKEAKKLKKEGWQSAQEHSHWRSSSTSHTSCRWSMMSLCTQST